MTDPLAQLAADEQEMEQAATAAYQRWRQRRRALASRWIILALGVTIGAGTTALLIAALRWIP